MASSAPVSRKNMSQVITTLKNTFIRHSIRSVAHFCDDRRDDADILEETFEQQQRALENSIF